MNGRRLFREYAQEMKGKQAKSFLRIENDYYFDTLITIDDKGNEEKSTIDYKEMVHWIIRNKKQTNHE